MGTLLTTIISSIGTLALAACEPAPKRTSHPIDLALVQSSVQVHQSDRQAVAQPHRRPRAFDVSATSINRALRAILRSWADCGTNRAS